MEKRKCGLNTKFRAKELKLEHLTTEIICYLTSPNLNHNHITWQNLYLISQELRSRIYFIYIVFWNAIRVFCVTDYSSLPKMFSMSSTIGDGEDTLISLGFKSQGWWNIRVLNLFSTSLLLQPLYPVLQNIKSLQDEPCQTLHLT